MHRLASIAVTLSIAVVTLRDGCAAPPTADAFEAQTYQAAGAAIPYRLLRPEKIEPGKRYPLVLFLHGAGERGTDNAKQLIHGTGEFAKPENRQKYSCFLVAPQCPAGRRWAELDWSRPAKAGPEPPPEPLQLALDLVDKLVADLPVDRSRIYVTGLSMGGFGTWAAIARRPEFFAAAIPICGGGDPATAPKLKNLPIWAFHGDNDHTVPSQRTTAMIDAIRKAGGTPKLTLYPGVGHDSWTRTYSDPAVLAWFFSQRRGRH